VADAYNQPEKLFHAVTETAEEFGWQDLPLIAYASMGAWEFGGEITWPSSEYDQAPKVTRYPVSKPEDIETLEAPEIEKAGIVPLMMEVSRMQAESGAALVASMTLGPWSLACNICGIETIFRWSIRSPELAHKLQKKLLPFSVGLMRYWVDTFGADRLFPWVGGSAAASNQLISPDHFREFVLPYMKELYHEARALGLKHIYCHICGEQNMNLPYWSQLDYGDPGIVSFGHEVDLQTAAEHFPKHIIMGNINPSILQSGTPEDVYEVTKEVIEKGKKCPGGFMLGPGCEMPPRAPVENILAMMQAVSDFGWYE